MEILIVSDLHGRVPKDLEFFSKTFHGPVVFLGNVVGTSNLDQLQKMFYDDLYNPIKELFRTKPEPSLREITLFPIGDSRILYDGCTGLERFLNQFGKFRINSFSKFVYGIAQYAHFGHFIGNLPIGIREVLQEDMETNSGKIVNLMTNFTARNQDVFVVEGNCDARTPFDFCPTKECNSVPVPQRSFNFKDFLLGLDPKIHYFDTVGTVKFEENVFVFWPFDCSTTPTLVPEIYREDIKKVVLFSHSQADWQSVNNDIPMTNEDVKVQKVMAQVITDLNPDLIVHGHLHVDKPDYTFHNIPVCYCPLLCVRKLTI